MNGLAKKKKNSLNAIPFLEQFFVNGKFLFLRKTINNLMLKLIGGDW